jgi:hypothetical protein
MSASWHSLLGLAVMSAGVAGMASCATSDEPDLGPPAAAADSGVNGSGGAGTGATGGHAGAAAGTGGSGAHAGKGGAGGSGAGGVGGSGASAGRGGTGGSVAGTGGGAAGTGGNSTDPLLGLFGNLAGNGIQLFPPDHVYNSRADKLPLYQYSTEVMNRLKFDSATNPATLDRYFKGGVPYNVVDSTTPRYKNTCFNKERYDAGMYDDVEYPVPPDLAHELGSTDGYSLVLDIDEMKSYERPGTHSCASCAGGVCSTGGVVWDLTTNNWRQITPEHPFGQFPDWNITCGIPGLAGQVRYDEVSAGVIPHALRLGVAHLASGFVFPARASGFKLYPPPPYTVMSPVDRVGLPANSPMMYPPAGLRIRLKASYDISGFSANNQVILTALKQYGGFCSIDDGTYVEDPNTPSGWSYTTPGSGSLAISVTPDPRFGDGYSGDMAEIRTVPLTAFEAVDNSVIIADPLTRSEIDASLPSYKFYDSTFHITHYCTSKTMRVKPYP